VRKHVSGYNICMESILTDPDAKRLPPADTRILDLRAEPYPDGKRLRIALDLTPFEQKPYLELTLNNTTGEVVATASIIEPVVWRIELTLHIRERVLNAGEAILKIPTSPYQLEATLSYPDLGQIDHRDLTVIITTTTA
jgi:hypothetical protein